MDTLHLVGSVNKKMLRELIDFLAGDARNVTIRITSHGGESDLGLAMAGLLRTYPGEVTTEVYGQCYSAATLIFAAGDSRRMHKFSWVMVHEGSLTVEGNATTVKQAAKNMEKNETHWNGIMAEFTGTDAKTWEKLSEKDTYLNADECLKLGLATEVF